MHTQLNIKERRIRGEMEIRGSDLLFRFDGEMARLPLDEAASRIEDWRRRYAACLLQNAFSEIGVIGGEMFDWLDAENLAQRWFAQSFGERILEIRALSAADPDSVAVLDLPWEVLRHPSEGFLAGDPNRLFLVHRRLGEEAVPFASNHADFSAIFMAAAPEGMHELDYELEESAILTATEKLPMRLIVEETGALEPLTDRLALEVPFDALHISCHGNIDNDKGPVLALESEIGTLDLVSTPGLLRALGEQKPPLVFLSACRTAEAEENSRHIPFARALIEGGAANALGWDGSVYDSDAITFAAVFYRELARGRTPSYAAAMARAALLEANARDPKRGAHWPLARVWLGPKGGGALIDPKKPRRPDRRNLAQKAFLGKKSEIPVASAREFVGRRRSLQRVIRSLRDPDSIGALIWGMGNLGKSSLAARLAERMSEHRLAVVYGRYDASAIFEEILGALDPDQRRPVAEQWRAQIDADPTALADALETLLAGPFVQTPLLLIIDDLERILQIPGPQSEARQLVRDAPGAPEAWRQALRAVLGAFDRAHDRSKLIFTSRYDFALPDGGRDLSDLLAREHLGAMQERARSKQWRAAYEALPEAERATPLDIALLDRAVAAAGGNPGLQALLIRPILTGENEAAEQAIAQIEHWRATGEHPQEASAAQDFFARMAFETYRGALNEPQKRFLRTACLFAEGIPVPAQALDAAAKAAGVEAPAAARARLLALGLLDDLGEQSAWKNTPRSPHAAANALARPLVTPLNASEQEKLALAALVPLHEAWGDEKENFPVDARGAEAARLALICAAQCPGDLLAAAAEAGGLHLFDNLHDARGALELIRPALERQAKQNQPIRPWLLFRSIDCAERIGDARAQDEWLALAEDRLPEDASIRGSLRGRLRA